MAYLIELTQVGGLYAGKKVDTKFSVNADNIESVEDITSGLGTSKIITVNKTELVVTETRNRITELINKR